MNHFRCSDGTKVSKAEIDKRVYKAKTEKVKRFREEHGYLFCEDCGRNDCLPIDCSHTISVDECQKSGRAEIAWDIDNIVLRGRKCHEKHDNNDIRNPIIKEAPYSFNCPATGIRIYKGDNCNYDENSGVFTHITVNN